jgi:hypothetical protein
MTAYYISFLKFGVRNLKYYLGYVRRFGEVGGFGSLRARLKTMIVASPPPPPTDPTENSYVGQSANCPIRNHELCCTQRTLARDYLPWRGGLGLSDVQTV